MLFRTYATCPGAWDYALAASLAVADAVVYAATDAPRCVVNDLQVRLRVLLNTWSLTQPHY